MVGLSTVGMYNLMRHFQQTLPNSRCVNGSVQVEK